MTVCRQRRTTLGMSQKKLADLAGIPQPYVSQIELRRSVHPDDLAAVARVLGLKPEELTEVLTFEKETVE